jgi:hypothetical protein
MVSVPETSVHQGDGVIAACGKSRRTSSKHVTYEMFQTS